MAIKMSRPDKIGFQNSKVKLDNLYQNLESQLLFINDENNISEFLI